MTTTFKSMSVSIDPDRLSRLEAEEEARNTNKSQIVRDALDEYWEGGDD